MEIHRNGGRHLEERYFLDEHPSYTLQIVTSVFIIVDIKRCFGQVHTELCVCAKPITWLNLGARFSLYLVKQMIAYNNYSI